MKIIKLSQPQTKIGNYSGFSNSHEETKSLNRDITQLSQIVSHYLRSPITKIKSIMMHLKDDNNTNHLKPDNLLINEALKETNKAEIIIAELDRMLSDNNSGKIKKYVSFRKSLNQTIQLVKNDFENVDFVLETDLSFPRGVFTAVGFVDNLFYFLITNSIKTQGTNYPVKISIKSFEYGNLTVLEYADNSESFNEGQKQGKILNLFKRSSETNVISIAGYNHVLSMAEKAGCKIEIRNSGNDQKCFRIYFP